MSINIFMTERKSAINDLWLNAQQQSYYNTLSHSYVKVFSPSFPESKVNAFVNDDHCHSAEFVEDELVWDGKLFGGSKKI